MEWNGIAHCSFRSIVDPEVMRAFALSCLSNILPSVSSPLSPEVIAIRTMGCTLEPIFYFWPPSSKDTSSPFFQQLMSLLFVCENGIERRQRRKVSLPGKEPTNLMEVTIFLRPFLNSHNFFLRTSSVRKNILFIQK